MNATATKTFKSGTRVEVRVGFANAESWVPAKIVIPRKSKWRPAHPAGYHVVEYADGRGSAVHETSFRIVGKAAL
jgi:hypothetical protein